MSSIDILKRENTLPATRRKKKVKEEKKSILEMYKSEKTIKDYLFYLKDFLKYVYEGNDDLSIEEIVPLMNEIEKDDVDDYVSHLASERGMKKTSINKVISSLKSMYAELERNGYDNPCKHLQLFRTARDLENVLKLSYSDIKEILKVYPVTSDKSFRNTLILQTLFYTGMRSQEIIDLKFRHILKRDEEYIIKLERTKSGKEQYKPMHKFLEEKIINYKKFVMELYNINLEEIEEQYIFPSSFEKNTQLSYRALYSLIQEMGKKIGKDISPHNIRHAIATELSLNGADILEIRDFLGHSDSRVTEIYINAKSILQKRVLDKIPVPNLD